MTLPESYGKVLYDMSQTADAKGQSRFFDNLIKTLTKQGHTRLLPAILRTYQAHTDADKKQNTCTLICARETDIKKYHKELKQFAGDNACLHMETILDERIIGGFILRKHTVVLDNSYKNKLLLLYRSVIA